MPEGDSVYQAAARVRTAFEGKVIAHCQFRVPRFATVDLSGRTVESVRSVGKHHLIDVGDDLSIHTHLKMEGAWHVHPIGTKWRRPAFHARLVLRTDTHEAVAFEMGICEMLTDADGALAYIGPDLLGPTWDTDVAVANLMRDPDRPIGLALLDQHLMAGVGNVFRCEACFLRGVDPRRKVADVDIPAMVDLCHRLLQANRSRIRTTTGVNVNGKRYYVYGRGRKPCFRCGTPISRDFLGEDDSEERVLYHCTRCQT
ncbi:DNA-formamidopyrimidine glycosylase family protein [Williamsia maris]|uniref:DNA-(apurinic or apyrimidinic site) lyase n=1 Tax=Williamsia maris TaxID=72806 RepID=A0ABT1H7R7_9NOCA|nr:DNA-formamidopyrimidine glycosylase family protein [Williamsia maris]MCP2174307.1 endonuclease-8 [Williamsia maris]